MKPDSIKIALLGNPNIGKTTLFNFLCGLNQKTGNYAGVTVDQVKGYITHQQNSLEIIDLPGVNSIYPESEDERVVFNYLTQKNHEDLPDKIIVVISALNFKRNLYLFHQIKDLELPIILAVNMLDTAEKRGISINLELLRQTVGCPVVGISAKTGEGIEDLKNLLVKKDISTSSSLITDYLVDIDKDIFSGSAEQNGYKKPYEYFVKLVFNKEESIIKSLAGDEASAKKLRINESILRYKTINRYLLNVYAEDRANAKDFSNKLDKVLMHPVWGYIVFLTIMLIVFQSIFSLAEYPMGWIDNIMDRFSNLVHELLPSGKLNELLAKGIIPGIQGVIIFVPQIAILFFFFSLLEQSGYMTRIVFLMDKLMQKFGMSGKSVVPLISGMACAIPAIMSTRTIENSKERLITILVTPLVTCSARLPVYSILISIVVPDVFYGPIGLQGTAMLGMYFLGAITSLIAGWIFKKILKSVKKSVLALEVPRYILPSFRNVAISVWTNSFAFIKNAGLIIVATSIILFFLGTNGGAEFKKESEYTELNYPSLSIAELNYKKANERLENSYLGSVGKTIEPLIEPLGYDWKVGIALISSLAAREVFTTTLKVIYSIAESEDSKGTAEQMKKEINSNTGKPTFGIASGISLLLFYAFALQCFSTVAVTYKETKSIKWTSIQFAYMGILAYFAALIAYQILI